jgi:hypothetical protein
MELSAFGELQQKASDSAAQRVDGIACAGAADAYGTAKQ